MIDGGGWCPCLSGMAGRTQIGGIDVVRALAGGDGAIVTGYTTADDLAVINR